jgi:hypothetical protein
VNLEATNRARLTEGSQHRASSVTAVSPATLNHMALRITLASLGQLDQLVGHYHGYGIGSAGQSKCFE